MPYERLRLPAYALRAGDILRPTNRTVVRVIRDGVYMRSFHDKPTRVPFPKNRVEIMVEREDGTAYVDYWRTRTLVTVDRWTGGDA